MHVSMQHNNVILRCQQLKCRFGGHTQNAAMLLSCTTERFKPHCERGQRGWGVDSWPMELAQNSAHRATRLVVLAFTSKIDQRNARFSALHEDRILRVREYARRALSLPPNHQLVSNFLFVQECDLEHGQTITRQDGQECTRGCRYRRAIRR